MSVCIKDQIQNMNLVIGCTVGCDYCYARNNVKRYHMIEDFAKPEFFPGKLRLMEKPKPQNFLLTGMSDLSVWKKEFLTQDIADFQAKMNASGKSFPGRASVISELQSYALQPLTADSIPGKLQQVLAFQTRKRRLIRMVQSLPDDDRKILAKLPTQEEYQAAAAAADEYRGRAESFPGGSAAVRSLSKNTDAVKALEEFRDAYPKALLAEQEFDNLLRRELCSDDDDWAEPETAFCQYLLDQPAALKDWGLYCFSSLRMTVF